MLTVFQIIQLDAKFGSIEAGGNSIDAIIDLSFDGKKLIFFCSYVNDAGGFIIFLGDMLGEGIKIRLRGQTLFDGIYNDRLQLVAAYRFIMASVRPIALLIMFCAGVIMVFMAFALGDIGHIFRAADAAFNQAGEQENALRGRCNAAVLVFVIFKAILHGQPYIHIDNRGNRAVDADLSRIWFPANIFPHALVGIFVPNVNPCVARIFEHIIQGIFIHGLSLPANDAADVQLVHDIGVGVAAIIQIERLADEFRLGRHNHISLLLDGVSIRRITAEEFPFTGGGGNAVHRLLSRLQYHVVPEADRDEFPEKVIGIQWISELLMTGNDIHAKLAHLLPKREPIGNIAGAAAYVINNDGGKLFCAGGGKHILKAVSVRICAGLPLVDEAVRQPDIIFRAIPGDLVHLVRNRVFSLIVCGVAGIRRSGRFHKITSFV